MNDAALVERIRKLLTDTQAADQFALSGIQTEARAILAELPPPPVDPVTLRAREIVAAWLRDDKEVSSIAYQADQVEAGELDNSAIMRLTRFALSYEPPKDVASEWTEWTAPAGYYVPPTLGPCWVRNRYGTEWATRGDQVDWRNVVVAYRLPK